MENLKNKLSQAISNQDIGGSLLINVTDCFSMSFDDNGMLSDQKTGHDCIISLAEDVLLQLVSGDLDPMGAYFSGSLLIDGNMSIAMTLSNLMSK